MTAIRGRLPRLGHAWALLLALLLLALPMPFGDTALQALRYERAGLEAGELWRLLGAHFVHLNAGHALGDMAALVLLWLLFEPVLSPRTWALVLGASLVAIDAGLWWLSPAVAWYAGVSGLLHGAWAAGAAEGTARRDPLAIALFALLVLKLVWEQLNGASLLYAHLPVVVQAHAYGALGGLLAWRTARSRQRL